MIVIRNTVWLSVCRIAADLSGLVLFTVISRRYGPMGTGEYSYSFALGAFIAILATSGIEQYGVRQRARLPARRHTSALALCVVRERLARGGVVSPGAACC
jgi:O-antigen/teichoic acid export membrane protein